MSTIEATADEVLVGLGPHAEERLSPEWARRRDRVRDGLMVALLVGVQMVWVAALVYGAYVFIG